MKTIVTLLIMLLSLPAFCAQSAGLVESGERREVSLRRRTRPILER